MATTTENTVTVPVAELWRLHSMLGQIPGGAGAPDYSISRGDVPELHVLLNALQDDIGHMQRMCEGYEHDRQDLFNLRLDLAAVGRVLAIVTPTPTTS